MSALEATAAPDSAPLPELATGVGGAGGGAGGGSSGGGSSSGSEGGSGGGGGDGDRRLNLPEAEWAGMSRNQRRSWLRWGGRRG